jgi:hypothetical protein
MMRLFLLSFLNIAAYISLVHAASTNDAEQSVIPLLTQVASATDDRPYGAVLDEMQSKGELLIDQSDEENAARKTAMDHAFWAHYAALKLNQSPLSNSSPLTAYTNILALIRDPSAPKIERIDLSCLDDLDEMLDIIVVKLKVSWDLLFCPFVADPSEPFIQIAAILLANAHPQVNQCMDWFAKVAASKDAQSKQSNGILIGRLSRLASFVNAASLSANPVAKAKVRQLIEDHIIANSGECPDRAISGLDDIEVGIALSQSTSMGDALNYLLRCYKKQIIRECLVEHQYFESAQEYVYLLLLLNEHFNLDVCSAGIWSGQCGARKSFDVAVKLMMENISVEGFAHYLAKHPVLRNFITAQPDHQEAMHAAASDPNHAEDAIYNYMRRIIDPYVHERFVITGDKFQELSEDDLATLKGFLPLSAD